MSLPIVDDPSPSQQDQDLLDASFDAGLPSADLCSFKLPFFLFKFQFKLPALVLHNIMSFLPKLAIGINCADPFANPFSVSGVTPPNGGRIANPPVDPNDTYDDPGTT